MRQKIVLLVSVLFQIIALSVVVNGQWRKSTPSTAGVRCFAMNGSILFAGTYGNGVFCSTDNGLSWSPANAGLTNDTIFTLATIGTNLFAGSLGGVFRSSDSGGRWKNTSIGLTDSSGVAHNIVSLGVMGTTLFAGTGGLDGRNNLFRSTDSGNTWILSNFGLSKYMCISNFAVVDTTLFTAVSEFGVFASTDVGASWKKISNNFPNNPVGAFIVMDTSLFVGEYGDYGSGVFRSTDKGVTWITAGLTNTNIYALEASGPNLFAGTGDPAVFLSTDSGSSWTEKSEGLSAIVISFIQNSSYLFATSGTVWRRWLSDFNSVSSLHRFTSGLSTSPNPFAIKTTIKFSQSQGSAAEVSILNLLGQEVTQLFSGELSAGEHSFTWDAKAMPAGMYVCVVRRNGRAEQIPIVLVR